MPTHDEIPPVPATGPATIAGSSAEEQSEQLLTAAHIDDADLPRVGARYIWFLLLALFGAYVAFVTPIALSLAIRVEQLAPANEEYLGYVIGVASIVALVAGPLTGVISDRTRSRFGRRRPSMVVGALVGSAGLYVMGIAPSIVVLTVGWIIASVGWNTVVGNITNSQADRLPESQRGQVAGLSGFVTMVGPVFGAVLGGVLSGDPVLLFMVPAVIGLVLVGLFVLLVHEDDSRGRTFDDELSLKVLVSKFVYDPRQHPDFSWNWLGRFLFYIGLTFNTTFTAFFYASRLGGQVADIGGIVALSGGLSVIAVMAGAIGSGFVSDKLRRRKPFVLAAGILFGVGAVVMAFSPTLPLILAGSFVTSIGLGIFSAVDQALLLDVLPERDTDAGRFVAINQLATSIAQAAAPLIAPAFLAIGVVAGGDRNYTLLYLVAAAFTIVGGAVVLKVRSVR